MALRSCILLLPGCCATTPPAAPPLLFQFSPRVDQQQHHHALPSRSSVQLRSVLAGTRDSSSPRAQQSWQDGTQQASSIFGGKRDGGVCSVGSGRFRLERTPSGSLFAKSHNNQSSRSQFTDGDAAAVVSSRGSTWEHFGRGVQHQQDAVNVRSGTVRGVKEEAFTGRGEGIWWNAAPACTRTCGEYGTTGEGGGTRRRTSWLYPRTQQQQQPLHQQRSANLAGCTASGSGRRCTAVFLSASMGDGASADSAGSGTRPTTGGVAAGGERRKLGGDKGPNREMSDDSAVFAILAGEQAKPLLPGAAAAAAIDQRTGKVASRAEGVHSATVAASPQQERDSSGVINEFELEATAVGGEFTDAEVMDPIAESYERGRWLLGLLVLQSTSSFVLDKYQVCMYSKYEHCQFRSAGRRWLTSRSDLFLVLSRENQDACRIWTVYLLSTSIQLLTKPSPVGQNTICPVYL